MKKLLTIALLGVMALGLDALGAAGGSGAETVSFKLNLITPVRSRMFDLYWNKHEGATVGEFVTFVRSFLGIAGTCHIGSKVCYKTDSTVPFDESRLRENQPVLFAPDNSVPLGVLDGLFAGPAVPRPTALAAAPGPEEAN